jgi:hypothetical protein
MSYSATAGAINITPESFHNWMNWGKTGTKDPIYSRLYAAVREAESLLIQDCLLKLRKSGETGNIESVKFILERRFPQDWSKKDNINVQARSENVNINVNPKLKQEETERIRQAILAKLARPVQDSENPIINVTNGREDRTLHLG